MQQERLVAHGIERQALGGRYLHFAAQVAAGVDQLLEFGDMGFGLLIQLPGVADRVLGNADRIACFASKRCHLLPQFFGNEGDDWMRQTQDGFQHANQRVAGAALLCVVTGLDLHLGNFQVPVTEFVPDKLVDGVGHIVEPVIGEALCHGGFGALQLADNPAVGGAAFQGRVGLHAAIVTLAIHQYEAGGVPQLVAEVAIAFAALAVEVDAAAQARQRGKGEAQGIGAVGRNAFGKFLFGVFAHLGRGFGLAQTGGALFQQYGQGDAIDQVYRIKHIAFRFAHLFALRIAHQAVDVYIAERHAAGEVGRHHDHAGDPEENDVVARDEDGGGQVEVVILGGVAVLQGFGPAQAAEGHQRAGVPGVEHVFVAGERHTGPRLGLCFSLVAGHIDIARLVIPRRNLVAPPQLAADAPVLDVVHPLVVGIDPLLGHEAHLAALYGINGFLGDAGARAHAGLGGLAHGHEPLVSEHGLYHRAGTRADRQHVFVRFDLDDVVARLQIRQKRLACVVAVHALVFGRAVFVDVRVEREDGDQRQIVPQSAGVVVKVVRAGDLDAA